MRLGWLGLLLAMGATWSTRLLAESKNTESESRRWLALVDLELRNSCGKSYDTFKGNVRLIFRINDFIRTAQNLDEKQKLLNAKERNDVMRSLGSRNRYVERCMSAIYLAAVPCTRYVFRSAEANDCSIRPLVTALNQSPFRVCADNARNDRVRMWCQTGVHIVKSELDKLTLAEIIDRDL